MRAASSPTALSHTAGTTCSSGRLQPSSPCGEQCQIHMPLKPMTPLLGSWPKEMLAGESVVIHAGFFTRAACGPENLEVPKTPARESANYANLYLKKLRSLMNERGRVPLTLGGTKTSCKALGRSRPVHKADGFVVPTAKKEHQSLLRHRTGKEVSCDLISAHGIYVLKVFINSFFFFKPQTSHS